MTYSNPLHISDVARIGTKPQSNSILNLYLM